MTALPLDVELAGLLNGHHLVAHVEGDRVVLPAAGAWADLRLYESAAGRFVMEVRTALPGGSVLLDTWAAWGATQQEARRDGLAAFCRGTFHVLLALWGILETDQVAHEVRTVAGRNWDVYLGPLVNRQSAGGAGLVPPTDFADAVLAIIDARMRDEAAHVVRIYHAMSQGKAMVTEALWDGEPFSDLQAAVAAADWGAIPSGFASTRWFLAVRPREDGHPGHSIERTCG